MASNLVSLKFKSRNASHPCDKGLVEQYNNGGLFDVELQTTDGKSVPAHRFVLAMFSKTWANTLRMCGLDGVIARKYSAQFECTFSPFHKRQFAHDFRSFWFMFVFACDSANC